jgi:hypothetical protein
VYNEIENGGILLAESTNFLTYKGKPLVRCGNIIYYGNLADKCIVFMIVTATTQQNGMEVATNVRFELQYTNPAMKASERVIKTGEKGSLYAALDVASIWLTRALEE